MDYLSEYLRYKKLYKKLYLKLRGGASLDRLKKLIIDILNDLNNFIIADIAYIDKINQGFSELDIDCYNNKLKILETLHNSYNNELKILTEIKKLITSYNFTAGTILNDTIYINKK